MSAPRKFSSFNSSIVNIFEDPACANILKKLGKEGVPQELVKKELIDYLVNKDLKAQTKDDPSVGVVNNTKKFSHLVESFLTLLDSKNSVSALNGPPGGKPFKG